LWHSFSVWLSNLFFGLFRASSQPVLRPQWLFTGDLTRAALQQSVASAASLPRLIIRQIVEQAAKIRGILFPFGSATFFRASSRPVLQPQRLFTGDLTRAVLQQSVTSAASLPRLIVRQIVVIHQKFLKSHYFFCLKWRNLFLFTFFTAHGAE
jgi:hypothetical protein